MNDVTIGNLLLIKVFFIVNINRCRDGSTDSTLKSNSKMNSFLDKTMFDRRTRHCIFFFNGNLFNVSLIGISALWMRGMKPLIFFVKFTFSPRWSTWLMVTYDDKYKSLFCFCFESCEHIQQLEIYFNKTSNLNVSVSDERSFDDTPSIERKKHHRFWLATTKINRYFSFTSSMNKWQDCSIMKYR